MLEHLRGSGASITRQAALQGFGWTISATWLTNDAILEKKLKMKSHFERHCAICAGDGMQMQLDLPRLHYSPKKEASPSSTTSWP